METPLLTPIYRALAQLDDPRLLGVLLQSVLLSALCFGGLAVGSVWLVHQLVAHGTLGWIAGALGGALAIFAALWLFVPIAVVIAGLFLEPVCRAVERRWYPNLPPSRPAGLLVQGWDGLVVGLQVLGLTLISLTLALFLPGPGHLIGWLVTAWAVGRGMFSAVAMRRMDRRSALAFYDQIRWAVLAQGALLTLGGTVPILNLLLPVVGTAAMVHLIQLHSHKIGTWS
jgi:CysZ protein